MARVDVMKFGEASEFEKLGVDQMPLRKKNTSKVELQKRPQGRRKKYELPRGAPGPPDPCPGKRLRQYRWHLT